MQANIVKIGNSKGLRLSKTLLDQYNITDKVELILEKNQIILRPISTPRAYWKASFEKMKELGDDSMLMDDVFHDEDFEPWK